MPSKRALEETDLETIDATTKRARRKSLLDIVPESHHLPASAKQATQKLSNEMPEINGASPTTVKEEDTKAIKMLPVPSNDFSSEIKKKVIARVNGRETAPLCGLAEEYAEVYNLLEHTIAEGEGNSCLLIGPRSCGKTLLVNTALQRLEEKYHGHFLTIKLSGFAQGEDKMALREICRQFDLQLSKDTTLKDFSGLEKKGMSDTLQALLDLLDPQPVSFDDEEMEPAPMSVVIVLEEFDRFAQVARQTLLYNLFDLAQSSRTPIAVIGITPRINTRELFEKRVRSRFSQRVFSVSRASTLDEFWQICRATLTVRPEELSSDSESARRAAEKWNAAFDELYSNPESSFFKLLESTFYTTKDFREFYDKLLFTLHKAGSQINDSDINKHTTFQEIASAQNFMQGLSELELSLLICAARAEIKFESEVLNFNVVYDEYTSMANATKKERMAATSSLEMGPRSGYRIWSREVARSAWERLESMELILYVDSSGGCTGNSNGAGGLNNVGSTSLTAASNNAKGGAVRDDLKMAKVDVNLLEIRNVIGTESGLRSWTRL